MKAQLRFVWFFSLSIIITCIVGYFVILNTNMNTKQTSYERMIVQQFVTVQDTRYPEDEVSFNLKTHEFYSSSRAVKNGRAYGIDSTVASKLYKEWEEFILTYGILKIAITNNEIINHGYILEFDAKDFINSKKLSNIQRGDIENFYTKYKMSKVRVTYNKKFLPTKLECYYEKNGEMSWNTIRTYSYPFKNKSDFDKKLDEQIQLIEEIASEKEGD